MVQLSANVLNAGRDMVPWYKVPACRAARRSAATSDTVESLLNVGRDMLPKNIIKASAESSYLGIMVFLCAARAAPAARQGSLRALISAAGLHCTAMVCLRMLQPGLNTHTQQAWLAPARPDHACMWQCMTWWLMVVYGHVCPTTRCFTLRCAHSRLRSAPGSTAAAGPCRALCLCDPRARAHAAEPVPAAPQHCRGRGAVRHGPARGAADPDRGDGQRRHNEAGARPNPNPAPSLVWSRRGPRLRVDALRALPCTCCRPQWTCTASASRRRQRRARQACHAP